ncbi:Hsp20/alpha crystallin family protein [Lacipirellula parvula]|uniref:SHSP domain-containing protein n=1 Tax=Lacipirellula parvula TaxID=2650471 RepID=A0A5K7XGK2_9BACT|nr:Hsp20/alpha crystallin family protein [Lacipirellula parvula]BBO33373.1 hypothetical protein PLANPX_2985 [Lacipirellula parvula]
MNSALVRNRLPNHVGEFGSMMEQFLSAHAGSGIQAYYVPASISEDSNAYQIELDVPGVMRDDVELTFEKGMLRITTERRAPDESRKGLVDERRYGRVTRTVTLPETIDPDSITAELNNGVLHVSVSKKPEAQPKRIEVR